MRLLAPVFALLIILLPNSACTKIHIYSMVVGDKVLELCDTRQLTFTDDGRVSEAFISPNGKYVVYTVDKGNFDLQLCIIRSGGSKPSVLMDGSEAAVEKQLKQDPNRDVWIPTALDSSPTANPWSPDSSMLAFRAVRLIPESEGERQESWLLVTGTNGGVRASFKLPERSYLNSSVRWAPDGRSICFSLLTEPADTEDKRSIQCSILRLHIPDGNVHEIVSHSQPMNIIRWIQDDKALEYILRNQNKYELHEIRLDGSSDHVISDDYKNSGFESADGRYRVALDKPRIHVLDLQTQDSVHAVKDKDAQFSCWLPNSKMFIYTRAYTITDEQSSRKEDVDQLWLSSINGTKYGRMCIATGFDPSIQPSWSADCMKMAYVYRSRLHLAELAWRDPNAGEKAAAGLPLMEEEEKGLLMLQAKQIGVALEQYKLDKQGQLLTQDNICDELLQFVEGRDVFCRPGNGQNVFKYLPQESERPSETVIGTMDAGYGWVVELYADGHVTTRDK